MLYINIICIAADAGGWTDVQGRLNIYNQSMVLAKSPYNAVAASSLTKDSTVTKQTTCTAASATG